MKWNALESAARTVAMNGGLVKLVRNGVCYLLDIEATIVAGLTTVTGHPRAAFPLGGVPC